MAENPTLEQLNIELFSELHRLRQVDVSDKDALKAEVERSHAVEGISKTIISNASIMLEATKLRTHYDQQLKMPKLLNGE
jgi:hypothetical protein